MAERSELQGRVERWIEDSFGPGSPEPRHLKRTADWVEKLRPNADDALLIAAVAHDSERIVRTKLPKNLNDNRHHQETGAELTAEFLRNQGASTKLVERVSHLISKHEEGGDEDQNLLKDADSISFFENQTDHFPGKWIPQIGVDGVREKYRFMLERISNPRARAIARPMYEQAMKRLEQATK